jgi:hypothetical protein
VAVGPGHQAPDLQGDPAGIGPRGRGRAVERAVEGAIERPGGGRAWRLLGSHSEFIDSQGRALKVRERNAESNSGNSQAPLVNTHPNNHTWTLWRVRTGGYLPLVRILLRPRP